MQYTFLGWPTLSLCFPGDDIPECMSHISLGNKVTIELPLDFLTNPGRGLAICAVVSLKQPLERSDMDGDLTVSCNFLTTYSTKTFKNIFQWDLSALINNNKWHHHVFLGYISCSELHSLAQMCDGHWIPYCVLEGELWFEISESMRYMLKVKSCGVHPIDEQHGSDSRLLTESGTSSQALTSPVTYVASAGMLSEDGDFITYSGSRTKRSLNDPSCSNDLLPRNGFYDEEPQAKRPKELN